MGKTLFWLVMGGMVLFVGIAFFPAIHGILNLSDTTGMPDLLKAAVTFFPYMLIFFIIYMAYKNAKGGQ